MGWLEFLLDIAGGVALWVLTSMVCMTAAVMMVDGGKRLLDAHQRRVQARKHLRTVLGGNLAEMGHIHIYSPYVRFPMGDTYRKYIAGLPLERKHEMLDQMLRNAEKRTKSPSMEENIQAMHEVEVETLATITLAGTEHESWNHVRAELPNAVIVFRLTNPLQK